MKLCYKDSRLWRIFLTGYLLVMVMAVAAQPGTVSGRVLDENAQPMTGVDVVVRGTTTGTITNENGYYSLDVPDMQGVLTFSFIGYQTREVEIEGRTQINVEMLPDISELSEVVVIGYGVQKKSDLTGSVASVKAEEIADLPTSNLTQALQGRAPGVMITTNSGSPGGDLSVRIRGIGSINNNDPLIVIDGFPTKEGLSSLNPDDIERIDILKDASATAIYGARGANGVIIVSTKRGKPGKTVFSFDSYVGVENFAGKYEMLDAVNYAELYNEIVTNSQIQNERPVVPYFFWDPQKDGNYVAAEDTVPISVWLPRDSSDIDWVDVISQQGVVQNYTLSARGGSEDSRYSLSGTYFDQKGVIKGSGYRRFSFLANTDNEIGERLIIGSSVIFNNTNRQSIIEEGPGRTVMGRALRMMPTMEPYRPDGTFNCANDNPGGSRNPLRDALQDTRETLGNDLTATVYAELEIIDGLVYKLTGGANWYSSKYTFFQPSYGILGDKWFNTDADASKRFAKGHNYLMENQLSYIKSLGRHHLAAVAAYTAQDDYYEYMSAEVEGFTHPNLRQLSSGISKKDIQGGIQEWALLSQLGRINYDYDERYYITASVRRDGSSRFGTENRYGIFPSFALKWRLSRERFMSDLDFISDLSLRGGYGRVGNQEIGNYAAYAKLSSVGWVSGDVLLLNSGMAPNEMPNSAVRWESTKMTNIGLDASFFSNRLMFSVEYYNRGTEGMLLEKPIPTTTGYTDLPFVNAGEIVNRGVEGSLTFRQRSSRFFYDVSLNASYNQNEVANLGGAAAIPGGSLSGGGAGFITLTEVGHPIGSFYGFVVDGILQNEGEVLEAPYQTRATAPGDIRFKDLNGDGRVNDLDRTYIGSPWPDMIYGFNASLGYSNFTLDIFLQGVLGNDIYFQEKNNYTGISGSNNQHISALEYWSEENPSSTLPRPILGDPSENTRISDRYVEDGSYLRVKNVTLSYRLSQSVVQTLRMSGIQVYVSASNLFTLTNYSGIDPEVGEYNGSLYSGIDRGQYPVTRAITGGVKLDF